MNPTTITGTTFTVTGPVGLVTGTVTYSGVGASAKFTPTGGLTAGAAYTATISTGAQDLAGNAFATPFNWSFTAGTLPDNTVPTISSTTPATGATGVAISAGTTGTSPGPGINA